MNNNENVFFSLLRLGIGNEETNYQFLDSEVDWKVIYEISQNHGCTALVLDALEKVFDSDIRINMDFQVKMDWIGTVQQMEAVYKIHQQAIDSLAFFYSKWDIRLLLLKGIGLSYNYPRPLHRPCGDIDIYLFGDIERGDKLVQEQLGIKVDRDQHKHTAFQYHGTTIENHFDFINIYKHKSAKKLNEWLKVEVLQSKVKDKIWLPSPLFNSVFLIRHAASHFASDHITLRHLLDWAFFVEENYDKVNWALQWKMCKEQNMHRFLLAVNDICVNRLGFSSNKFRLGADPELVERIYNDIMHPHLLKNTRNVLTDIYNRNKRWWGNRWKQKIVYPESLLSTFVQQIYAYVINPASILR